MTAPAQRRTHRAPGERANAQLKTWHILRKLRCCPWRAGHLAKAIHVLQTRETKDEKGSLCAIGAPAVRTRDSVQDPVQRTDELPAADGDAVVQEPGTCRTDERTIADGG
jgi:hypothetical protein